MSEEIETFTCDQCGEEVEWGFARDTDWGLLCESCHLGNVGDLLGHLGDPESGEVDGEETP